MELVHNPSRNYVNQENAKVWKRPDGITQIDIHSNHTLRSKHIVDLISKVYELNPHDESTRLLIDFKKKNTLSSDARFFLTNCANVGATALIGKKSVIKKIVGFFKGKKDPGTFKSFENPDSGARWLAKF